MGGDISMYFAKDVPPNQIKKVVTLDNYLRRCRFMTEGQIQDPVVPFEGSGVQGRSPGVVPNEEVLREVRHYGCADRLPSTPT